VRLLFCGTRGSTPAPGAEFVRYGGNTACVAISSDTGGPTLVLDGGTGLRRLARHLGGAPFRGTILLGHLHWDHTQGLPFFGSADHPESRTTVALPAQGEPEEVLGRCLGPPFFPLRPSELRGHWGFTGLEAGVHEIEGFSVTALDIPHGAGRAFGYRVSDGSSTLAYLSDHSPTSLGPGPEGRGEYHPAAVSLAADVDVLIHDGQHVDDEFPEKAFLGHSTVEYAIALAERCRVGRVVLFHHDPDRTDDQIDAIVAKHQHHRVRVSAAVEGMGLDVPDRQPGEDR
jgi:phosphoribosyl 1,2-cyclic phosphodiesterase